jgi:hypothetical protein
MLTPPRPALHHRQPARPTKVFKSCSRISQHPTISTCKRRLNFDALDTGYNSAQAGTSSPENVISPCKKKQQLCEQFTESLPQLTEVSLVTASVSANMSAHISTPTQVRSFDKYKQPKITNMFSQHKKKNSGRNEVLSGCKERRSLCVTNNVRGGEFFGDRSTTIL